MLGLIKFNLPGYYRSSWTAYTFRSFFASINCCKKTFYRNDNKITEFEIIDSKNSSTAYVILYELVDLRVLDSNRRVGVWLLSWRWQILPILLIASRGISAETCGLGDVFPPDDLFSRPETLCYYIFIYMYAFFIQVLVLGRVYTYAGSVVRYCWSCTPSQSLGLFFGSARFLCWMPLVVLFGFINCVLLYDNKTNTRILLPLVFVLNNVLTLGILFSAVSHLTGCFCPWTFFQNIGFNTETEMLSFWWNLHHWLHWKLSKWQLPVPPVMKISSKWRHFRFSEHGTIRPLYVGLLFGNRLLNNIWAVGLTWWTVNLFFVFWHVELYMP